MSIKSNVRAKLLASPPVVALVGTKIFSGNVSQGSIPFILMNVKNTDFIHFDRGTDLTKQCRIQFDCVSNSSDQAELIGDALIAALNNSTGNQSSNKIQESRVTNRLDDDWSADVGLFRHIVDFQISYTD